MHQLSTCEREQQPTSPPPGPLDSAPLAPYPSLLLRVVIRKLRRPAQGIYSNRHPQLLGRVNRKHEPRQTRPDSRGEARGQRPPGPLVPLAKRARLGRQEVRSQAREEAEEDPVQEEDRGYREREPEILALPERQFLPSGVYNQLRAFIYHSGGAGETYCAPFLPKTRSMTRP